MMKTATTASASKWDLAGIAGIALVSIALRVTFAWQYTGHPLGQYPWVDEASYWTWAQAIRAGQWLPIAPFYQDPLYPYWLAGLMVPCGTGVATLRLVSAALGVGTPLVVMWVGRRFLGRAEGFVAGGLMAFYGPLIFVDGSLEKEGLATFGVAVALGATAAWSRGGRWLGPRAAGAGFAWGVVALLRSNALLVAPLAVAWWLVATRGRSPLGRRLIPVAGFVAGWVVAVAPAVGANYLVARPREWLGTTWQLGPNFYIGNNPGATGQYAAPPFVRGNPAYEAGDFTAEAARRAGRRLTVGEVNRYWFGRGLQHWWDAPGSAASLLARKVQMVTSHREIPDNQDPVFIALVAAPALRAGLVGFGVLLPLAALSLGKPGPTPFVRFVQLATALGLGATAVFFVVGRYRVPWTPGLALLAAVGLVDLIRRVRVRDGRGVLARLAFLLVPGIALAWWPDLGPPPQDWGTNLLKLGLAHLRAGQIDAAIDAFDDARALDAKAARLIRSTCASQAVRERFEAAWQATQADPSGPTPSPRRARLLRQIPDRVPEAIALLRASLRDHPADPALGRELGLALSDRATSPNHFAAALVSLREAARQGDRSAAIALALATNDVTGLLPGRVQSTPAEAARLRLARFIIDGRRPD